MNYKSVETANLAVVRTSALSFAMAIFFLLATTFSVGNVQGQDEREKKPLPRPKRVKTPHQPEEEPVPVKEQAIDKLFKFATKNKGPAGLYAFNTLASIENLDETLNEKELRLLIQVGLNAAEDKISAATIKILDRCDLPEESRMDLLVGAVDSKNANTRDTAQERLAEKKDEVIKRYTEAVNDKPSLSRANEILLFEQWGPEASAAVPAILKNFEALTDRKQEKYWRVDFLNMVYAIAEIGPQAKDAMAIPVAALGRRTNADEYQLAGIMCLERIMGKSETNEGQTAKPDRKLSSRDRNAEAMMKMMRQMQGGGRVQGMMHGGGLLTNVVYEEQPTVRDRVRAILADRLESEASTQKLVRQVELTFQNHDLYTDGGGENQLSIQEIRTMDPPMLMSDVDKNNDNQISKEELTEYYKVLLKREREIELNKQKRNDKISEQRLKMMESLSGGGRSRSSRSR